MSDQVLSRLTAAEFLELPESMTPTELIDGVMLVSPAPKLIHQECVLRVSVLLNGLGQSGKLYVAPVDVYFDEANVVQPDLLWLASDSRCVPVEGQYLRGVPELVAEVLSPGSVRRDRREKFELYEKYGVREYWLLDPAERYIEIYQHDGSHFLRQGVYGPQDKFVSPVLGDQTVEVSQIFPAE
jgi:Uma2 family endonuclease